MLNCSSLKPGDLVEIIAPASRCSDERIIELQKLMNSWGLDCFFAPDIFGDDILCANSDAHRFTLLKNALYHPKTKAIIAARGGYGAMRLIPELTKLSPPPHSKLFIGMSDITALNLYLNQVWHWPVLHAIPAPDKFSEESIKAVHAVLFNDIAKIELIGTPLNLQAQKNVSLETVMTGGNLCLVQTSIGTPWQIDSRNKIIFLEEINERGYRVDRSLEHLRQAKIFEEAAAIVFGDFLDGNESDGRSLIPLVLKRFAENISIPVVQVNGIGHGRTNFPIPIGSKVKMSLGKEIKLTIN